jgi:hypothetical protein
LELRILQDQQPRATYVNGDGLYQLSRDIVTSIAQEYSQNPILAAQRPQEMAAMAERYVEDFYANTDANLIPKLHRKGKEMTVLHAWPVNTLCM